MSGVIQFAVPTETSSQALGVFACPQPLQLAVGLVARHFTVGYRAIETRSGMSEPHV